MINLDEVNFTECHSETVISFFWRSVYIWIKQAKHIQIVSQKDVMLDFFILYY